MKSYRDALLAALVISLLVMGAGTAFASFEPGTSEKAIVLYELDLFLGVDPDAFVPDLESSTDRAAAMVMIARALEWTQSPDWNETATSGFSDVPHWAEPHVAYAVEKGITVGIGEGRFGNDMPVTERQLQTWFERALGYGDTWQNNVPLDNVTPLNRADLVDAAWDALIEVPAGETDTLIEIMVREDEGRRSVATAGGLLPENYLPGEIVGSAVPEGPAVREGIIEIEGMEERTTYFRHHLDTQYVVTYVPENIEVAVDEGEDADIVSMYTTFGGIHREDVHLTFTLYDPAEEMGHIVEAERTQLEADGYDIRRVHGINRAHPWAKLEMGFERTSGGEHYVGRLAFGQRGDRVLSVMTHMPIEFGDGVVPRFRSILESAQWYFPDE
ncbi:MAG: S-layer homology domain-containing protein [Bacillota bacterium]